MTTPYPSSSSSSSASPLAAPSGSSADPARRIRDAAISTAGSAGALRPRNRRLISTELTSSGPGANGEGGNGSRSRSPIPSRHPSRAAGAGGTGLVGGLLSSGRDEIGARVRDVGFGRGIWEGGLTGSWTALQGLASSVLGVDAVEGHTGREGGRAGDVVRKRARGGSVKKAPTIWGPSGLEGRGDGIGAGSAAERDAALRAMKTASLLESVEGVNGGLDVNGNYKRRMSIQRPSSGNGDEGGDALVYVHHVQPQDTLLGVALKYSCQAAVLRKANRLWPNDIIQIRKVVLLPVDACAVKGRPCGPPSDNGVIDLLAPTPGIEDPPSSNASSVDGGGWPFSSLDDANQRDVPKPGEDGQSWTHVRWVLLDSSPSAKAVEVARLPRKTLGYFPPRRRKSQSTFSSASTPRSSFDIHHMSQAVQSTAGNGVGTYFPAPAPTPHSQSHRRRDSSTHSSPAAPQLPSWLRGPGGVGSLSKDVRSPGPGEDSLNSWAQRHMPILGIGNLPSSSASGGSGPTVSFGFRDELASIAHGEQALRPFPTAAGSGSGAVTPSGSGGGAGMGLENAAAAIEGWVRRLAIKAQAPGTPTLGFGGGNKAMPELGEGDLIEMLDGAGSDDGKGFDTSAGHARPTVGLGGSGRADPAARLRGRLQPGSGMGANVKGKGKSD